MFTFFLARITKEKKAGFKVVLCGTIVLDLMLLLLAQAVFKMVFMVVSGFIANGIV
jgi:hypothetical protein